MTKDTKIILDLNGVVQEHAMPTFRKYGLQLLRSREMSLKVFFSMFVKVLKNQGAFTADEQKFIDMFYTGGYHIEIPFLPGAVQTVRQLMVDYPGGVYVCSANAYSDAIDARYADYLTQHIGKFEEIYFVKPMAPKIEIYRDMHRRFPDSEIVVVDDSRRHIAEAKSLELDTRYINKKNGFANLHDAFYRQNRQK